MCAGSASAVTDPEGHRILRTRTRTRTRTRAVPEPTVFDRGASTRQPTIDLSAQGVERRESCGDLRVLRGLCGDPSPLPVSDAGHRHDGGPSTPHTKAPDLGAPGVEPRESCGDPPCPPRPLWCPPLRHSGLNHREHGGRRGLTASTRRSQSRSPGIGRTGALPPPRNRIRISARETWSRGNHAETLCDLRVLCGDSFPPFPIPYPRASAGWGPFHPPKTESGSRRARRGTAGIMRRPSVSSATSVVTPSPPQNEPQRTRRTQRVVGSHDTLPVSEGGDRHEGRVKPQMTRRVRPTPSAENDGGHIRMSPDCDAEHNMHGTAITMAQLMLAARNV